MSTGVCRGQKTLQQVPIPIFLLNFKRLGLLNYYFSESTMTYETMNLSSNILSYYFYEIKLTIFTETYRAVKKSTGISSY